MLLWGEGKHTGGIVLFMARNHKSPQLLLWPLRFINILGLPFACNACVCIETHSHARIYPSAFIYIPHANCEPKYRWINRMRFGEAATAGVIIGTVENAALSARESLLRWLSVAIMKRFSETSCEGTVSPQSKARARRRHVCHFAVSRSR